MLSTPPRATPGRVLAMLYSRMKFTNISSRPSHLSLRHQHNNNDNTDGNNNNGDNKDRGDGQKQHRTATATATVTRRERGVAGWAISGAYECPWRTHKSNVRGCWKLSAAEQLANTPSSTLEVAAATRGTTAVGVTSSCSDFWSLLLRTLTRPLAAS